MPGALEPLLELIGALQLPPLPVVVNVMSCPILCPDALVAVTRK